MFKKLLRWIGKPTLSHLIEIKDPEIYNQIKAICKVMAEREARKICMAWLDKKRINHCRVCPNTDQLHRYSGFYLCSADLADAQKHQPEEKKEPVELGVVA